MKPAYVERGLDAWLEAVPLPLALPPVPRDRWTCLLCLLGPALAFKPGRYGQPLVSEGVLQALLERLGHSAPNHLSRALMLVMPVPEPSLSLASLLRPALWGPHRDDVAETLGALGDAHAIPWLEDLIHREASSPGVIDALGLLGETRALGDWDGMWDAQRLRALVRSGRVPEELPAGPLDVLADAFQGEPDGVRAALADLDGVESPAVEALALFLERRPELLHGVADALIAVVGRACEEPIWARLIGSLAADEDAEDARDALIERASDPDWRARMGAVMALGEVGGMSRVVDALQAALADDDNDVRREAALALNRVGVDAPLSAWTDNYGFIERASAHPWGAALVGGPVPRALFGVLTRRDAPDAVARTALLLGLHHPELAAPVLDALATDAGQPSAFPVRQAAAAGLLLTGRAPAGRGHTHRVLLRDAADRGAGAPLAGLSDNALAAIAARDDDWQVRLAALGLLGRLGVAGRHGDLLDALATSDTDSDVRALAAALRPPVWLGADTGAHLRDLICGSRADGEIPARGLRGLLEDDAALAAELADGLVESNERDVALAAARVLAAVPRDPDGAERLVDRALTGLRSGDWIRREVSACLLAELPPQSVPRARREAMLEVLEHLSTEDTDSDVRSMAERAAKAHGAHA